MTDEQLIMLYSKNEGEAVRVTVKLYLPYVRAIVKDKLAAFTKEDIEETVSDIFIQFWRNIGKVDLSRGSIRAYLCVLSKSTALRKREQLLRKDKNEAAELDDTIPDSVSSSFCDRHEIVEALSLLSDDDRHLIMSKYYFGMSHKEIGKALHISEKAAQKRTERALARLREIIGG